MKKLLLGGSALLALAAGGSAYAGGSTAPFSPLYSIPNAPNANNSSVFQRTRVGIASVYANVSDFAECDVGDSITAGVNTVGASTATYLGGHINSALGQRYLMMKAAGVPVSMASDWGDGSAYSHGFTIEQVTTGAPLTVTTNSGWGSAGSLGFGVFGIGAPFIATSTGVNLDFAATDGLAYDTVDLYYISRTTAGQNGSFTTQINSGTVSGATSTNAVDAIHKQTITFAATTNPTLHVSATAGNPLVYAVEFRSSTIHRWLLRNMSGGGSKTTDFSPTAHPWQFLPAFPTYGCNLTKVTLLTNDYASNIGASATQTAMTAIFAAVTTSSDVIYESPPPGSTTNGYAVQGPYFAAGVAAAQSFNLPIWDWNARGGSYAAMVSAGMMGAGDPLHPTIPEYRDEAAWQFSFLRQLGGF